MLKDILQSILNGTLKDNHEVTFDETIICIYVLQGFHSLHLKSHSTVMASVYFYAWLQGSSGHKSSCLALTIRIMPEKYVQICFNVEIPNVVRSRSIHSQQIWFGLCSSAQ